ncbi:MAG: acetyl-CoA carboxylase carboxyltransferase subunit alpha [Candidatus Saganbacteria bacterium]|nr:acetyl-CoA carboxylase carboxyltransferase subunit alpha [Candidatus Saganbacteria bacterium]
MAEQINKNLMDFEKPLLDLFKKADELKKLTESGKIDLSEEIAMIEKRIAHLRKEIFSGLTPIQIVKIARHMIRPTTLDYVNLIFEDFVELHGDRYFGDDPAMIGGLAKLEGEAVTIIGQQKGKTTKENLARNFGMAQPEGYRKALRLMKLAERFGKPIISFVDTPGAYPGIGAEERGQAEAIARNLREMSTLSVPLVVLITGEGGSGGALGIGVGNRVLMLEYAIYSVISPEGCASILFRDAKRAPDAAQAMGITANKLSDLGVIDEIIKEPIGGAHNDYELTARNIKASVIKHLGELKGLSPRELINNRYSRFRKMGFFEE